MQNQPPISGNAGIAGQPNPTPMPTTPQAPAPSASPSTVPPAQPVATAAASASAVPSPATDAASPVTSNSTTTDNVPTELVDAHGAPFGSIVDPVAAQPFGPAAPGTVPNFGNSAVTSRPDPVPATPPRKSYRNLIETIALVVVSLIAVTFIGLFIWKYLDWDAVKTNIDSQIDTAVAWAVAENTTKLEEEFVEREKYPYKNFSGPADYGSLSFEYPKTWNLYVAKDAASGGDFAAYLNPGEVQPVSTTSINALRVTIRDTAFDTVVRTYDSIVRNGRASIVTRNVGSSVANVYTGELPNNIRGIVTIFKLRDKTVLIQTDAELFADEYYKLLDTVTFVE